jgi:hypothetical protein
VTSGEEETKKKPCKSTAGNDETKPSYGNTAGTDETKPSYGSTAGTNETTPSYGSGSPPSGTTDYGKSNKTTAGSDETNQGKIRGYGETSEKSNAQSLVVSVASMLSGLAFLLL